MNRRPSDYDPDLQMFIERPREPDPARLGFLRWLAEHGHLEHGIAGPPGGAMRPCPAPRDRPAPAPAAGPPPSPAEASGSGRAVEQR